MKRNFITAVILSLTAFGGYVVHSNAFAESSTKAGTSNDAKSAQDKAKSVKPIMKEAKSHKESSVIHKNDNKMMTKAK